MDDTAQPSAAELLEHNRDLQGSRAIRLLATHNLGLYATLMERHLADGVVPETELVVRLERDLDEVGHPDGQSGLALIKSWASQGWLHRLVDERSDQNVCYLTQDARRALDFVRGMRRNDTIATGGSINGIATRLKQVATRAGDDPDRVRAGIEAEIAALAPDIVIVATGGMPNTELFESGKEQDLVASAWDIIAGDVKPGQNVLIYDESGDHPGLMAAEVAANAGATVEVMTPDRTFAPDIMAMNLVPYMRALQDKDVTFTVTRRLLDVLRDGNELKAVIGTDYSDLRTEKRYDQVVVNYGTLPMDELYFDLKPLSSNGGAVDYDALIDGQTQTVTRGPADGFQLFRIGDAVSARNTHAAIYDALRLARTI